MIKAGVLTISDKGSRGQRKNESGPLVAEVLTRAGYTVEKQGTVPDDHEKIAECLLEWVDEDGLSVPGTGSHPLSKLVQGVTRIVGHDEEASNVGGVQPVCDAPLDLGDEPAPEVPAGPVGQQDHGPMVEGELAEGLLDVVLGRTAVGS